MRVRGQVGGFRVDRDQTAGENVLEEIADEVVTVGEAERGESLAGKEVVEMGQGFPTGASWGHGGRASGVEEAELGSRDVGLVVEHEFWAGGDGGEP